MERPTRRRLLSAGGAVALGAVAGCLAGADGSSPGDSEDPGGPEDPNGSEDPKDSDDPEDPGGTTDPDSLTDWERSTTCDRMHDSVISVQEVRTTIEDRFVPIHFSELPDDEQGILGVVLEEGGYGTCDASDAFSGFVSRVSDRRRRQDGDASAYLERDGTYYGLYVEQGDQVFTY